MGQDRSLSCPTCGLIRPPAGRPLAWRLRAVYEGLREVIAAHRPDEMAVEDVFFARNAKAALALGHVRGVALLAAAETGLEVFSYSPRTIKKALVGYGQASKDQVSRMVVSLLDLKDAPGQDATDALACAICHLNTSSTLRRLGG